MKLRYLLIGAALAFAAGALVANRSNHGSLHLALRSGASVSARPGAAKRFTRLDEPTTERRFGDILSALQGPSQLRRQHDLFRAMGDLSAVEVAALIVRAERMPPASRTEVLSALLARWFELDPNAAQAWILTRRNALDNWLCFGVWAAMAPESALAHAHAHPFSPGSMSVFQIAKKTFGADKKAQAAGLAALPPDFQRDRVLATTVKEWANTEPAEAFAFGRSLPTSALRQSITEDALRAWAKQDPQRAAQEAQALLAELTPGLNGHPTIAALAGELSKKDPHAALLWLSELPEEQRGFAPYAAAASAWATTEPLAALAWCRENGLDLGGRGGAVISAAIDSDSLGTVRWLQSLPPGDEREAMVEKAISSGSKLNFPPIIAANAEIVLGLLQELRPDAQERAAYQLGWNSGHSGKLEDVRAWTERLSDPALRAAAVEAAVRYRYGANPSNRDKLLEQFPIGPERDGALAGIAAQDRERTPARAAQSALEITDPVTRLAVLDSVIGEWLDRRPNEARAWLRDIRSVPIQWRNEWLAESSAQPGTQ